ncbi:TonB-dependent siderophore receptor [Achromobacter sp. K91]|uniref:TonB-dependent siderophore receptor n=1 Tax=Achromobacter sp. K91 TaxID=2292262 RepID=UPI000E67633B|nr:TonB-dependent siderophore receptor [Achromobacter sp. K91]RIJ06083.1 TonB-dependent siderophore receptor [Achromobacter sp. K91]
MCLPYIRFNPALLTVAISLTLSDPGIVRAQAATADNSVTGIAAAQAPNTAFSPPPSVGAVTILPAVAVEAESESASGPINGYVAKRSATGTKTDTPIIETPQSISVIGAEEIETRKAADLMNALNYTAGVVRLEGADRTSESFLLRGFVMNPQNGSFYRDGMKYNVNTYNGLQEPYGLERIELLKGAPSVLYGTAAPGGIINTVSKRPTTDPLHELNVDMGSFNRKQISGDFSGALTEDGAWSYRLTALKRDSDSFTDYVPDDRTYIAPALKWQPSAGTSLTLLSEYQRDRTTYVYGLPAEGTILSNPNGKISRSRFVGEPDYDDFEVTRRSIGYLFEHALTNDLVLRNSARYFDANNNYPSTWDRGIASDLRTLIRRNSIDRQDRSRAVVMDTSLQYKWSTGNISHTSLLGFDYTSQHHESERYRRTAPELDVFDPLYGGSLGTPEPLDYSWKDNRAQLGIYAQNQAKIADRWVVLLGGRYDKARNSERAFFTDEIITDNEKSHAFTGRVGLVYLADNGLAPYVSFSQSFEPQSGTDRNRERFKPTRGEQWELGLRYQPEGDMLISTAIYDLTQTDMLVTDPVDPDYSVQFGKVRSRGFELEMKARIGRQANLILAYAYTDARTLESSPLTPEEKGKRTEGVAYNQFSLWGDYSFGEFGLPGLKAGAGIRYVGSAVARGRGDWGNASVPAFTLFDAMVSYTTGPWKLALNVTNLTDKTYIASCTYGCFYGDPRKVLGTVTYRW